MTTLDPQPLPTTARTRAIGLVLLKLLVAAVVTLIIGELMTSAAPRSMQSLDTALLLQTPRAT